MIVAGTRPEAIKLAPVIWWLNRLDVDYVFVWSGQHYDYEMSKIFFEQLRLPEPDKFLGVGLQASVVEEQVALLIKRIAETIKEFDTKIVYALGDTNTTLATVLASVYVSKPFIHDEAGMRSFDLSMLEEINRRVADAIAVFRFAPTRIAVINLLYEGMPQHTIRLVGSTAVDTLLYALTNNLIREDVLEVYNLEPNRYVVITIHRRENLTEKTLCNIILALVEISRKLQGTKIVFPVHPHTLNRLNQLGLLNTLTAQNNILLLKPMGYFEFLALLKNACLVITDSGGVQEEAFILGKRIITLRKITEWPETVILGYNILVDPNNFNEIVQNVVDALNHRLESHKQPLFVSPLGDGNAGRRVARLLSLLVEKDIQREFEIRITDHVYPIPYITDLSEAHNVTLCFENRLPLPLALQVYKDRKSIDGKRTEIKCVERGTLTKEDLIKIIEVDWNSIDKYLEEVLV
jgi:UDP-N-acetylglucosamine 2-epimerase (non-hydrolysing)